MNGLIYYFAYKDSSIWYCFDPVYLCCGLQTFMELMEVFWAIEIIKDTNRCYSSVY